MSKAQISMTEKQKKALARQQAIVNGARAAGHPLTAEEQTEFDGLQRQIDDPNNNPDGGSRGADNGDQGGAEGGTPPTDGNRGAGGNPPAPSATPTPAGNDDATRQAITAERQRNNDIVALCRQTGMEPDQFIRDGNTMDAVRAAAVTHMIQHGAPVGARMNGDQADSFRQAAMDAVLMRAGVPVEHPAETADQFRSMSMRDLAIECMSRDGEGSPASLLRMSKDDLWTMACRQFFNPTSSFPAILDNAIKKAIVHQYQHENTKSRGGSDLERYSRHQQNGGNQDGGYIHGPRQRRGRQPGYFHPGPGTPMDYGLGSHDGRHTDRLHQGHRLGAAGRQPDPALRLFRSG